MNSFSRGLIAGFSATAAISLLALLQMAAGLFAEMNAIQMQADMLNRYFALPRIIATGWISHFFVGTFIYGGFFGAFNRYIPGRTELSKALFLAMAGWILTLFVFMPLAGTGFFGAQAGLLAPLVTLIMHIAFGLVLGYVYAHLFHRRATEPVFQPLGS